MKNTKTAAEKAEKKAEKAKDRWSQRAKFGNSKGARLDVIAKQTGSGFQSSVLLRRTKKEGEKKAATERGMVGTHTTKDEALKRFEALVADASKNGWTPRQMVTRTAFGEMPKADKV